MGGVKSGAGVWGTKYQTLPRPKCRIHLFLPSFFSQLLYPFVSIPQCVSYLTDMAGTAPAVTVTGSGPVPPSMSISSLAYLVPETPTKESAVATGPSPPSSLSSTPPTPPSKGTSPPRPLRRSRAVRRSLQPGVERMGPTPRVASLTRRSKVSFLSLPQEVSTSARAPDSADPRTGYLGCARLHHRARHEEPADGCGPGSQGVPQSTGESGIGE